MVTVFGDYYDHYSDISKAILILISLYCVDKSKFIMLIPIIILAFVLAMVHIGCQEIYYDTNESQSLNVTKNMRPISKNINSNNSQKNSAEKAMGYY